MVIALANKKAYFIPNVQAYYYVFMVSYHLSIILYNTSLQVAEQVICGRKPCPKHPNNYWCLMNVQNFTFATMISICSSYNGVQK